MNIFHNDVISCTTYSKQNYTKVWKTIEKLANVCKTMQKTAKVQFDSNSALNPTSQIAGPFFSTLCRQTHDRKTYISDFGISC